MKVSVIIVAKHAERTIRYAVKSMLSQTIKPHEIMVVVDSLADPTIEAIKDLPVKVIFNEDVGLGAARKTGVNASAGEVIAFIDADCVANEQWIENLVEVFFDSNVMVQAGRVINVKTLLDKPTTNKELTSGNPRLMDFAPTLNFAFRKEIINVVGNFDPWFKKGGEDLDFCIRLKQAGYKIFYNPNAEICHLAEGYDLRRAWRDGRSRAQSLIKHRNAMLSDAFIAFFHAMSLIASLILLVSGCLELAFLVLMLSLMHRLYRMIISVRQGNSVLASLLSSFMAYFSHISFVISLPILALNSYLKVNWAAD
jgi:glycosyltransferase involved in cell wall biosynthesis